MVKKLIKFLETTKNNEWVKFIGTKRKKDPKEENAVPVVFTVNTYGEGDDFDEYSLSDEEDRERKKAERDKLMTENRKNRKPSKNPTFK